MTDTQWVLEGESLLVEEERKYEEIGQIAEVFKKTLATYLGVNVMPVRDEETGLLREPEDYEIVPLAFFCGRPEVLQGVVEKRNEMETQDSVQGSTDRGEFEELSPDELEEVMSDIDFVGDDDMEKVLAWNSPASKFVRDNVVEKTKESIKVEKPESESIKIVSNEVSKPRNKKTSIQVDSD